MEAKIHYPSESSTIDALWTILSQQTDTVKKALADRLKDSLSQNMKSDRTKSMEEALDFVRTLSVKGGGPVPEDENGIETLINEKYFK